jgi:hypothetical protein
MLTLMIELIILRALQEEGLHVCVLKETIIIQ